MKLNSIPYVLLYMCFIKHSLVFPHFRCLSFSHDVFLYRIIFGKSVLHRTKSDCMMRKLSWVQSYKWFQQACLISAPSQFIFFIFLSKRLSTFSLKRHLWMIRKEVCQTVGNNGEYIFFNKARRLFWEKWCSKTGYMIPLYYFWRVHTIVWNVLLKKF